MKVRSKGINVVTIRMIAGLLLVLSFAVQGCGGSGSSGGSSSGSGSNTVLLGGTIQGAPLTALTGTVTTFAGLASFSSGSGTADGPGADARFYKPYGITTDGSNLFVADTANRAVRKIVIATRDVTTIAGLAGAPTGTVDGAGADARFAWPLGITTDGTDLYVADSNNYTIRKIRIATGAVSTFAGTAGQQNTTNGTGAAARFYFPMDITNDRENLYVVDGYGSANAIRKIVKSSGLVSTITTTLTGAEFGSVTTDGINLYLTGRETVGAGAGMIYKVIIATGGLSLVAGHTGVAGTDDGTGAAASFGAPSGITTDGTYLYVTDINNSNVRKIEISTGIVSTLSSMSAWPRGITSDGKSLFIPRQDYNCISRIQ